jgi:hypothetical protein
MDTQHIEIDRARAKELYRAYKKHAHYSQPIDKEIQRAYQLLAQGRLVIKALESVKNAGLKTDGLDAGWPKLGLCRADAKACTARIYEDGSCDMSAGNRAIWGRTPSRNVYRWPAKTFAPYRNRSYSATAIVPVVPLHLRPKRGLANYAILWDAEWSRIAPVDPMLLRRIGKGDLWLVVAMWDLSEVERAALSTRI